MHRDIKPANIYTCRLGREVDWIKVLDFGMVAHAPGSDDATRLTAEGITAGTPEYMAPEMATGLSGVDHRADIYALGCVAYWLVTGTLVFDGDNAVGTIVDHVQRQPEPPSRRCELAIPEALERLILDCLEKEAGGAPAIGRGAWTSPRETWRPTIAGRRAVRANGGACTCRRATRGEGTPRRRGPATQRARQPAPESGRLPRFAVPAAIAVSIGVLA